MLADWLTDIGMIQAGRSGVLDTFIGYYQPYATSNDDLDRAPDVFEEVRNAARSLVEMIRDPSRRLQAPDRDLHRTRGK